jgi:heme oxygenase
MDGSIMGGRIIIQIPDKLGVTTGISFFSGYGQDKKHGVFTKVMNDAANSLEQEEKAIKTVNKTFELFEKIFA